MGLSIRHNSGGRHRDYQENADLAEGMEQVIFGKDCSNIRLAERLQSAGLIVQDKDQRWVCGCGLYADYFGDKL